MDSIENKLTALGLRLEPAKQPAGNYLACKQSGDMLFVSGRVSDLQGETGSSVSADEAKQAAHDTVLLLLAIIKENIGDLDLIKGVIKMQGFIRSAPGFTEQPYVLNGASELLIQLFG